MTLKTTLRENILYFRIIAASVSWIGIILRFIPSELTPTEELFEPLKFFTIQTNLMVAVWLTLSIIYKDFRPDMRKDQMDRLYGRIKGGITSFITLTWIAYWVLLSGSSNLYGFRLVSSVINHYIIPVYFILDWYITEDQTYSLQDVSYWLSYPLMYLTFAYLMQTLFGDPIYSILDMDEVGLSGFLTTGTSLFLAFVIFCLIYYVISKFLNGTDNKFKTSGRIHPVEMK